MEMVRWLAGAGVLALAAAGAGCGGTGDTGDAGSVSQVWEEPPECEKPPEEEKCVCKVTGGGVDFVDPSGDRFTFGFNVIPTPNGIVGHITLQVHGDTDEKEFCRIDTIECSPPGAPTTATFSGELVGGGECLVTVVDNGEPGRDDTIDFLGGGFDFEQALTQGGNIQIHKPKPGECPAVDDNKNHKK